MTPLGDNPLRTRADLQQAVRQLFEPLRPFFNEACTAMVPVVHGQHYTPVGAGLEGFARPLWGLAPLAAGGGAFAHWSMYLRGLTAGTDPAHSAYWQEPVDHDQRFVEHASIAAAILLAPSTVWEPLSQTAKQNVVAWLQKINPRELPANNWHFFRVLANLALRSVGAEYDALRLAKDLEAIDAMYLGDGWYCDGERQKCDYYIAFAMHYYGLMYARLEAQRDPERAQRYRERAARFAQDFQYWFADNGSAIAYGRSMTYRFAQGAFWGALAFADVEALPWGVIKGMLLRHLRWWMRQPIFDGAGTLPVGYGYPNLIMGETYNGPGSSNWAMKIFLPLALPEDHPFWQADEALPDRPAKVSMQKHPLMLLCRDDATDHAFALSAGQPVAWPRHGLHKYNKMAYSSHFGFSVPCGPDLAVDSTLALSIDDGETWKVRGMTADHRVEPDQLISTWRPWRGVEVRTHLRPAENGWHTRVHYVRSDRPLRSVEGAFALDISTLNLAGDRMHDNGYGELKAGRAMLHYDTGCTGLIDVEGLRTGTTSGTQVNNNILRPRTIIPQLRGIHPAGEFVLRTAVLGSPDPAARTGAWLKPPQI